MTEGHPLNIRFLQALDLHNYFTKQSINFIIKQ